MDISTILLRKVGERGCCMSDLRAREGEALTDSCLGGIFCLMSDTPFLFLYPMLLDLVLEVCRSLPRRVPVAGSIAETREAQGGGASGRVLERSLGRLAEGRIAWHGWGGAKGWAVR